MRLRHVSRRRSRVVTALLGARIRSDPAALLGYYRSLGFELRLQLPDEKGAQELSDADLLARAEEAEYVNLVLERPRPGRAGQAR